MATSHFRIGSLLLSRQVINGVQLQQALQLQRTQRHKRIGQILLELRCLTTATLRQYLLRQKLLRAAGMLITLLGLPIEAVWAEPLGQVHWRSTCDSQLCSQAQQAAPTGLIIDVGRAIEALKGLLRTPYDKRQAMPQEVEFKRENRLQFNLNVSPEQPRFELVYRF